MSFNYYELDVWKKTRALVKNVYLISKEFRKEGLYGLTSQIRRCAVSIPSNIAEGCGRRHTKDSIQFFSIVRGSMFELETQVYLCYDLNYLDDNNLEELLSNINDCNKLINGFIRYYKGLKL